MEIVLMKRKFNTGKFAFDDSSVDAELKFSLHITKESIFHFVVCTGGFSSCERNPFKAWGVALESEMVGSIKYLRLKEKLYNNGMWKKL